MEILLKKTRKLINLKDDIISRGPNSCYSYEIRTKCTRPEAKVLYDKYVQPLMNRIVSHCDDMRNLDGLRIIPYGLGDLLFEDTSKERCIGIMFWDPILDSIPNDLVFHHGSYNLYVTEITNE